MSSAKNEQDHRLDLLKYQVNELETLNLQVGESEKLDIEYKRLSNASQLIQTTQETLNTLEQSDKGSISQQLNHFISELQQLGKTDNKLNDIASLLDNASIQINEATSELHQYVDNLELDPQRLSYLDERISTIHNLARKHNVNPDELPELFERLQKELDSIENADGHLEKLQQDIVVTADTYKKAANTLTKSRTKSAKILSTKVTENMQELGMEGGAFEVALNNYDAESFNKMVMNKLNFL